MRFRTEAVTSRIAQLAIVDALLASPALATYERSASECLGRKKSIGRDGSGNGQATDHPPPRMPACASAAAHPDQPHDRNIKPTRLQFAAQ